MELHSTEAFGPPILSPRGNLDLCAAALLLTAVRQCQTRNPRCIVVDLSRVSELGQGVARILVQLQRHLAQRQCRLLLLDASPAACRSLEAARGLVAA